VPDFDALRFVIGSGRDDVTPYEPTWQRAGSFAY